jgi:hypothetical protein
MTPPAGYVRPFEFPRITALSCGSSEELQDLSWNKWVQKSAISHLKENASELNSRLRPAMPRSQPQKVINAWVPFQMTIPGHFMLMPEA